MTESGWVSLVGQVAWPVAVLAVVIVLRRQIGDFLSAIGGRITQVSVMSVTIDLAVATETVLPWRGIGGEDVRGLVAAQLVSDSYFDTLRKSLTVSGTADFFVVDLKSEGRNEWLTSRLYLFTYVLSRMNGVRSVVFTATRGDVARSFLGVAGAEDLLHMLAAAQPWLRLARLQAEAHLAGWLPTAGVLPRPGPPGAPGVAPPSVAIPQDIAEWWRSELANPLYLAQQFLERVQWTQPAGVPDPEPGWLQLPTAPGPGITWEHATWITTADLTDGMLGSAIQPDSHVIDNRAWQAADRAKAVARAPGDFVALLGPAHRFGRLVDRRSLLDEIGKAAVKP